MNAEVCTIKSFICHTKQLQAMSYMEFYVTTIAASLVGSTLVFTDDHKFYDAHIHSDPLSN